MLTSSSSAVGAAEAGRDDRRGPPVHRRPPRRRVHQLEARRGARRDADRGQGAAGRDRQSLVRPRPRRSQSRAAPRTRWSAVCCFAGSPATSTGRSTSSTSGTSPRGTCSPTSVASTSERYLLTGPELHAATPLRRPQPDRECAAAAAADAGAAVRDGGGGDGADRRSPSHLRGRGPLGHPVVHLPQRQGARGARLGAAPARGDPRGHRALAARGARRARRGTPAHRPRPARHRPALRVLPFG